MIELTTGGIAKKNPDVHEKVVAKDLDFKLIQEEFAEKGKLAAEVAREVGALESKFADVKKDFKARIDIQSGKLDNILRIIRQGFETRRVDCLEQKNFKEGVCRYIFKGKVMLERPLEKHEYQIPLAFEDNTAGVAKEKEREAMGVFLNPPDREIMDVMREETSFKTKKDFT